MKTFLVVLALSLAGIVVHAKPAEPLPVHFLPIAGTASPDGAWTLAWALAGPKAKEFAIEHLDAAGIERVLDLMDIENGVEAINLLVSTKEKKPVAILPSGEHWEFPDNSHKNHSGVDVVWTPDSRVAIVLFQAKWESAGADWIIPAETRAIPLLDSLRDGFRTYLHKVSSKKFARVSSQVALEFSDPVLLPNETLILDASASVPKADEGMPSFRYRLKFKIDPSRKETPAVLEAGINIENEPFFTDDEALDKALNAAYTKLRAQLDDTGKEALKQEEKSWLTKRDALHDLERTEFVRKRVAELRARAIFGGRK